MCVYCNINGLNSKPNDRVKPPPNNSNTMANSLFSLPLRDTTPPTIPNSSRIAIYILRGTSSTVGKSSSSLFLAWYRGGGTDLFISYFCSPSPAFNSTRPTCSCSGQQQEQKHVPSPASLTAKPPLLSPGRRPPAVYEATREGGKEREESRIKSSYKSKATASGE